MKYLWDKPNEYNCLYEYSITQSLMNGVGETVTTAMSYDSNAPSDANGENIIELRRTMTLYTSPYSGGFDLKDTFRLPVACAFQSFNITPSIEYFYGQNKLDYNLENYDYGETYRSIVNPEFVFHNGSLVQDYFAWIDNDTEKIWIQTNDENHVDIHKTWIRGCDKLNNLYMLDLYINVSDNSAPEFIKPLQTTFNMDVGDTEEYKIPFFNDPEGNDKPEMFLTAMTGYNYPPFATFNNRTRQLTLKPHDASYEGRTYYIAVVLKESNSDYMKNVQYIKIIMSGTNPDDLFEKA